MKTLLAALVLSASAAGAAPPAAQPAAPTSYKLPAKPSELLVAPAAQWAPVLEWVGEVLAAQREAQDRLSRAELRELGIQQALLAQARGEWALVKAPVERVRRLQDSESGRHMAGLLNELLAEQRLQRGDAAWLRRQLRERLLAMPWAEVAPAVRQLREQLAGQQAESLTDLVKRRLDLSAGFAEHNVSLGFAMQLLGLRVQLQQVLPQREALLQGLDDALRLRDGAVPSAAKPASAPAVGAAAPAASAVQSGQ